MTSAAVEKLVLRFQTGNEFLADCNSSEPFLQGTCAGSIAFARDMHNTWVSQGFLSERICSPEGVTRGQLRRVVLKYMEEYPERLHNSSSSIVLHALTQAFPCEP